MLKRLLSKMDSAYYVQIWKNRIKVTNIESNQVFDEKPLLAVSLDEKGRKIIAAVGNDAALASGKT